MLYSMFNLSDSTLSVATLAPLFLADIILTGGMSVLGTISSRGVHAGWKYTQCIC